jgi:hypothetical protein
MLPIYPIAAVIVIAAALLILRQFGSGLWRPIIVVFAGLSVTTTLFGWLWPDALKFEIPTFSAVGGGTAVINWTWLVPYWPLLAVLSVMLIGYIIYS